MSSDLVQKYQRAAHHCLRVLQVQISQLVLQIVLQMHTPRWLLYLFRFLLMRLFIVYAFYVKFKSWWLLYFTCNLFYYAYLWCRARSWHILCASKLLHWMILIVRQIVQALQKPLQVVLNQVNEPPTLKLTVFSRWLNWSCFPWYKAIILPFFAGNNAADLGLLNGCLQELLDGIQVGLLVFSTCKFGGRLNTKHIFWINTRL